MDLTISIVSWNTSDLLDQCLESVYETTSGIEFEVLVVDNASSDGSQAMVQSKYPQARVIENSGNVGFAAANNQAYLAGSGRYFLLLNPDTVCHGNVLGQMVAFLDSNPEAGAVGPLVLNEDGSLQHSWARFPTFMSEVLGTLDRRINGFECESSKPSEVKAFGPFAAEWVGGCCLMLRKNALEQVGLMDEGYFMYCEETDWCLRLHRSGWQVWIDPSNEITHLGGRSSRLSGGKSVHYLINSKSRYFAKHHSRLQGKLLAGILAAKARARKVLNTRERA